MKPGVELPEQDSAESIRVEPAAESQPAGVGIQSGGFLLELSLDWIVLRASENAYQLLDESHVTLIEEPLGSFVRSEALHDLRNLFSRLSGTTGIARAYRIRLTEELELVDIAFQVSDGCVLLEAVPSPEEGFGQALSSVGGLIDGLADSKGDALLQGGVRRMRALTGYDRVTFLHGENRTESTRGAFPSPASTAGDLPAMIGDSDAQSIPVFPRDATETSIDAALLRSPDSAGVERLRAEGIRALLTVPVRLEDGSDGMFRCDSRRPRAPSFEVHAAAELFAQLFAMRMEIDRLKNRRS